MYLDLVGPTNTNPLGIKIVLWKTEKKLIEKFVFRQILIDSFLGREGEGREERGGEGERKERRWDGERKVRAGGGGEGREWGRRRNAKLAISLGENLPF